MKYLLLFALAYFSVFTSYAQKTKEYTRADTLRGSLNRWRNCYDVTFYDLHLKINPDNKYISGYNEIHYTAKEDFYKIQVDLYENLAVDSIMRGSERMSFLRKHDVIFISFLNKQYKGTNDIIRIYYQGHPQIAKRAPWDGGFVWDKDSHNQHWVGVACEGDGASLWWPNKDHLSDEPDSMKMSFQVPSDLMCISNGQQLGHEKLADGYTQYDWFVSYPINNYNITVNIGKYAYFSDYFTYQDREKLKLSYYVLNDNVAKAKRHFRQVKTMFKCFESLYGKYPFENDGYKLVEAPYWGMEHQSAIAYGNQYKNNQFGFDFIIVHESGHEYWGNSISVSDHAEMWIHEALTTYSDALFVECNYGLQKGQMYLDSLKGMIKNKQPILGPLGVNYRGWNDADMYYKGAWMMHSIRHTFDNDIVWFRTIKEMYEEFALSIVTTEDIINFINTRTMHQLKPIFNQYLKHADPPKLLYLLEHHGRKTVLKFKWKTAEKDFNLPMRIKLKSDKAFDTIYPTTEWQEEHYNIKNLEDISFDQSSFYFISERMENQ